MNWFVPDLHGSIAGSWDASEATVVSAVRYDAWGQTVGTGSGGGSPVATDLWRYQGRLDVSPPGLGTPLYDLSARLYSPGLGAFTSLDSVMGGAGDPLSMNRFLYAESNPATLIDPSGHDACAYDCDSDYDDGGRSRGNHVVDPAGMEQARDRESGPSSKKSSGSGDAPGHTPKSRDRASVGEIDAYTADSPQAIRSLARQCTVMDPLACQAWERALRHNHRFDELLCEADHAICEARDQERAANVALVLEVTAMVILLLPSGGTDTVAGTATIAATTAARSTIQQRLATLAQAAGARLSRSAPVVGEYDDSASGSTGRWRRGMDIYTKVGGQDPAWSTVRSRYWKNRSMDPDAAAYGDANLERMNRGLAPQRPNKNAPAGRESLELSHEPIPQRAGGRAIVERWPCDHALQDRYRFPGYC